jgi:hypothetical protein
VVRFSRIPAKTGDEMTRDEKLELVRTFDRAPKHSTGCPRCGNETIFLGWGRTCLTCGWRSDRNSDIAHIQHVLQHDLMRIVGVMDETLDKVVAYIHALDTPPQLDGSIRVITKANLKEIVFSDYLEHTQETFIVVKNGDKDYTAYYRSIDPAAPRGSGKTSLLAIADLSLNLLSKTDRLTVVDETIAKVVKEATQ